MDEKNKICLKLTPNELVNLMYAIKLAMRDRSLLEDIQCKNKLDKDAAKDLRSFGRLLNKLRREGKHHG